MQIDAILDTRAKPQALAELAVLAEAQGLGGIWVSSLNDSRDPYANLTLAAQATRRIALGPIAVNPFDTHPLKIAAAFLTLNEIAGGRARLVVGGGGEALEALGIKPARRVRAVRECIEIIQAAKTGAPVNHEGELYKVRNCRFGWLEAPQPPVYAGAGQEQMLRMAAQASDGIMMSDVPPGPARSVIAALDTALAARRKTRPAFWTSVFTAWHVYDDLAEARAEAKRWLLLRGIFRPWLLAEFLDPADVDLVMASRPAFARAFVTGSDKVEGVRDSVLDALVDHVTLCGTPRDIERIAEKLRALGAAGLGGVALRLYARPDASIRLISEHLSQLL
ncbi:MAG: LLM class flavin-dependent oxidoreductase [Gammaproteobacteria bacterium]|nr:LLM class flavin-dependent oxidoreductase [Gammaproteobacteria bacterium]